MYGYSRMMAEDEVATIDTLRRYREIIGAHVSAQRGRVVDSPGDNLLAEFSSALEAVRCGVAVQRELATHNSELDPARRMEFRIGIHLGDVIFEEGRIYGDGVNIAARLEALAQAGGICISNAVYEQVHGKLDIVCEDIGERQIKNIPRRVRVLRVRTDSVPAPRGVASLIARYAPRKFAPWIIAGLLIFAGIAAWRMARTAKHFLGKTVELQRLTDFVGLEEFPAISPDAKTVAFSADTGPNRQIWVRLIAGGRPLQITKDAAEHVFPRWTRDSASIIYYSPPPKGVAQGTLWEVSALGGTPRRLATSLSGADVSHDGKKLAFFRLNDKEQIDLAVLDRDTSQLRVLSELPSRFEYIYPRWSPDDSSIAYQRGSQLWADDIFLVQASGGSPRQITHEGVLSGGLCWLPDGSGVLFSSARGSTILYLPTMHLWSVGIDGSGPTQVSYGETSLQNPDLDVDGKLVASRLRIQHQIWKYPVDGTPADNVSHAQAITQQTGIVETPSVSPDDRQLAYLSDEGGHGNVWIMNLDTKESRQLTSEHDPRVTVGVPVWSPDGVNLALVSTRDTPNWDILGLWVINPDGSNLRRLAEQVSGFATWSNDSRWLYYTKQSGDVYQILKTELATGRSALVRTDNGWSSAVTPDGSALYYMVPLLNVNGVADYEVRVARPDTGPSQALARISGDRFPHWQNPQAVISHLGKWLVLPLNDGVQTNLWLVSTADGKLRQVTDFGSRRTFIARRVSWSSNDRYVYAAVGDGDSDIIQMEGILP